jgi:hypothetical protein
MQLNEHVQYMLGEAPNDFDAMSVTQTFSPLTLLLRSCFMKTHCLLQQTRKR